MPVGMSKATPTDSMLLPIRVCQGMSAGMAYAASHLEGVAATTDRVCCLPQLPEHIVPELKEHIDAMTDLPGLGSCTRPHPAAPSAASIARQQGGGLAQSWSRSRALPCASSQTTPGHLLPCHKRPGTACSGIAALPVLSSLPHCWLHAECHASNTAVK